MDLIRRRWWVALAAVLVVGVVGVVGVVLSERGSSAQDQCSKPLPERTGGWFCYTPLDGDTPSPGPS